MEFRKWSVSLNITVDTNKVGYTVVKTIIEKILSKARIGDILISNPTKISVTPMDDNGRCYVKGFNGWYMPSCMHGYRDCIYDPAYIKNSDPEWWEELGCPTSCEDCEDGDRYDDEDK